MITQFDQSDPLARVEGESLRQNDALHDYWMMGPGRSLRVLLLSYRNRSGSEGEAESPPTVRFTTLFKWSTQNQWQLRIERATILQRKKDEDLWEKRRAEIRERDYAQADKVRDLTDRILAEGPKFTKTTRRFVPGNGMKPDMEIVTVALDAKLMINGMTAASKLQRLAAEMETEHTVNENTTPENIEEVRQKRWESIKDALGESVGEGIEDPTVGPDDDDEESVE